MSTGIVSFNRVLNVLDGTSKAFRARHDGGTLRDYIADADVFHCEANGGRVDGDYRPRPGDRIALVDFPKETTTIALIAFSVLIAAGSYLVNRLTMAKIPKERGGEDFGPRGTFGGIQTIAENGAPVPFVYGKTRVGGNIIDSFESATIDEDNFIDPIENLDDLLKDLFGDVTIIKKNRLSRSFSTLNTRVALCSGPIESIGDIEIDERPITEYPGLIVSTRRGTTVQGSIPGFDQAVNSRLLVDPVLNGAPVVVTTQTEIQSAEIVLQFPQGIYKIKNDGFKYGIQVNIDVDYRLKDSTIWTNLGTFNINDFATTAVKYRIRLPLLDRNFYELRVTRNTADTDNQTNFSAFELFILNEQDFFPRHHPGLAMIAFQQMPGDQVSPVNPTNYTAVVTGLNQIRQYTDETTFSTGWTDNPAWIAGHFITDPEIGLGKFFTWDDIDILSFIAWADYADELVNDGNGFLETRATFNRAFSKGTTGWEVLQTITSGSGAMLIYRGSKFKAVIDRASPQVQTFTAANTKPGTLGMGWLATQELPRRVFGAFFNEATGYKLDSEMAEDQDAIPGERIPEKRFQLHHLTRKTQVARELQRVVNYNKFVTRGVQFKTGLQGIELELGDVIGISELSVARGLATGALIDVALDEKTLQLDDDVTFLPGTTYSIEIQHKDDGVLVTKNLVAVTVATTTNIVETVDAFWPRQIKRGDNYAVGIADETVELYRIDDIAMGDLGANFEMTIRAGRYDEQVFDLTPGSAPVIATTNAPGRNDRPPRLDDDGFRTSFRNVPTLGRFAKQRRRVIDVDWEPPATAFAVANYEVWFRENTAGGAWIHSLTTEGRRAELEIGIEDDVEYQVAVRAVAPSGHTLALDQSASALITTTPVGQELPPPSLLPDLVHFYRCDRAATGALLDEIVAFDLTESGGGISGSNPGVINLSRGPYTSPRVHSGGIGIAAPMDLTQNGGVLDRSVTGWVYMTAQTTDQAFIEIWDGTVANQAFILRFEVAFSALVAQMGDGAGGSAGTTDGGGVAEPFPLNTWVFVAMAYNSVTDELSVYRRTRFSATTHYFTITTGLGGFQNSARHALSVGGNTATSSESRQDLMSCHTQALTRSEMDFIYNDGDGLDVDQYPP